MTGIEKMADSVFGAVKDYVERRLAEFPAPKDGAPGERGADGAPGAAGRDGVDGKDGEPGQPGADGAPGEKGAPGVDGKSIDPAELDGMIQRAVTAAVEKAMGTIVVKDGTDGRDGRDGQKGEPGRDAAQLDILPAINEQRAYPRGTYATHKGGLWRTTRTSAGMDGWECVIDGVADVAVQFDGRKGLLWISKSSGAAAEHPFALPAMFYKGVFREGDRYEQGDTVTWGGSLWHCNAPTAEKPLDGSKAWTLATKKGRDGKDGRDGIDLTKAVKLS